MRRFLTRLALFLAPVVVTVGVPTLVLSWSGELTSIELAHTFQRLRPALHYGLSLSYPAKAYKLEGLRRLEPELTAIGSSRAMQIRASFFTRPGRFYNAGGLVSTPGDWAEIARRLPKSVRPRVVLLALDPWFWNASWLDKNPDAPGDMVTDVLALNTIQRNWVQVWRDLSSGKLPLRSLLFGHGIGLTAHVHDGGFRSDGSYDYGWYLTRADTSDHWDPRFRQTLARIAAANDRFEHATELDSRGERSLRSLLTALAERGTHVIAFAPPFAPTIGDRTRETPGYEYLSQLPARQRSILAEYGFPYFDFSDARTVGAEDDEFIDGYHGSERTYARIVLRMAASDPVLAEVLATEALRERLARATRFEPGPAKE